MCSMTLHPREERWSPLDHTKWTQVRRDWRTGIKVLRRSVAFIGDWLVGGAASVVGVGGGGAEVDE